MTKPRPLKFTAKLDTLNWRGEVETIEYAGECTFEDFDSEKFMKALNMGDLSALPSPLPKNTFYSDFARNIFPRLPPNIRRGDFRTLESDAVIGTVKFVVVANHNTVNEWRYVDGRGN